MIIMKKRRCKKNLNVCKNMKITSRTVLLKHVLIEVFIYKNKFQYIIIIYIYADMVKI